MDRNKLTKRLIYLIFFLLIANFIADKLHLYYSLWYFDVIMHFLGGFWVGLFYFYIFKSEKLSFRLFLKVFFFVLCIGVGWEIFEVLVNDIIVQNPFDVLDTTSDLLLDIFGGFCAIIYVWKKLQERQPR